ncbi:MAG TPA: hypothetical protein VFE45_03045 [Coriobacteriia bacterium]|nr:hypothetical protein [Coriobacteriia bacterium]
MTEERERAGEADPVEAVQSGSGSSPGADAPRRSRSRRPLFTPRQGLALTALALTLLLAALVLYLLFFLGRPRSFRQDQPRAGVQAVWAVYGPGEGELPQFASPMGIAVRARDRIYVTDAGNDRVCVFDPYGRYLFSFGELGVAKPLSGGANTYERGRLNYPVGIDTDEDGNVYVASFGNDSIEVFSPDGEPLRRFPDPLARVGLGASGKGGTGIAVTDVAVHQGLVYALDTYQVVVFTVEGGYVGQWGRPGSGEGALDHPNGITVGDDGTVYVSDSNNCRVTAFGPGGSVIWSVGTPPSAIRDTSTRPFQLPRGLSFVPGDGLIVTDAFGFSLVQISLDGAAFTSVGERGVEPSQLNFPNDVDVLHEDLVIADKGNGRIQRLRIVSE